MTVTIELPSGVVEAVRSACHRAGDREIGGVLLAEHVDAERFVVREATVDERGLFATFVRSVRHALERLEGFFRRTGHAYSRFNYLGEWHSHPQFALAPSGPDDRAMFDIVTDPATRARFAVLMIVRLDAAGQLVAGAWAYFPDGGRDVCSVDIQAPTGMRP